MTRELVARSRIWVARYPIGTGPRSRWHSEEDAHTARRRSDHCGSILALLGREPAFRLARARYPSAPGGSRCRRVLSPAADGMATPGARRGARRVGGESRSQRVGLKRWIMSAIRLSRN